MKIFKSFASAFSTVALTLLLTIASCSLPNQCSADEWNVHGDTVTATLKVGYNPEFTACSGTVSLMMQNVFESGKAKIATTILSIAPEPGFTSSVKKSGGVNGTVEIVFSSTTCESRFSFLYKPGLTRIDYGVMRCR